MATNILLGTFDGLHHGHAQLITAAQGAYRFLTFKNVPHKMGDMLYLFADRIAQMQHTHPRPVGVDWLDLQQHNMTALSFIDRVLKRYHPFVVVVGADYRFGCDRQDVHYLKHYLPQTIIVPRTKVASSQIKQALKNGQIEVANAQLLVPYYRTGTVVHGLKKGAELGFCTANINCDPTLIALRPGSYVVTVQLKNNAQYRGVVFVGASPTFKEKPAQLEVHLLEFNNNLYGQTLRVTLHTFIRPAMQFKNIEALRAAIQSDVDFARKYRG